MKITKRTKRKLLNAVFLITLIVVTILVVFLSQDINLGDVLHFIRSSNPVFLVAAVACMLGYILFEAASLHLITRKLGFKTKIVSSIAYASSDLYYSAITPSASGGQPASAFYMMRDGMSGGQAGFSVMMNIIAYTVATIMVGLVGIIGKPTILKNMDSPFAVFLVILGFVIQFIILGLLLLCLFRARTIKSIGNFGITCILKMHIIKTETADKWRERVLQTVDKYRACRGILKKHPVLFIWALLLNFAQRVSQTLVPCFVIYAIDPSTDFFLMFCMQAYVLMGYNCIPLPGGTGVYEFLYPNIFKTGGYDMKFVLSAMMTSRAISYYMCMVVAGMYTLIYHTFSLRSKKDKAVQISADELDIYSVIKEEIYDSGGAPEKDVPQIEVEVEQNNPNSQFEKAKAESAESEKEETL